MLSPRFKAIMLHAGAYEVLHAAASSAGLTVDEVVHAWLVSAGLLTPARGAAPTAEASVAAAEVAKALPTFFANLDVSVGWDRPPPPAPTLEKKVQEGLELRLATAKAKAEKDRAANEAVERRDAKRKADEEAAAAEKAKESTV